MLPVPEVELPDFVSDLQTNPQDDIAEQVAAYERIFVEEIKDALAK